MEKGFGGIMTDKAPYKLVLEELFEFFSIKQFSKTFMSFWLTEMQRHDVVDVLALRDEIFLNFDRLPVLKVQIEIITRIANNRKNAEYLRRKKEVKEVFDEERMPENGRQCFRLLHDLLDGKIDKATADTEFDRICQS